MSKVARGEARSSQTREGFMQAYKAVGGSAQAMHSRRATSNTSWAQRREGFVARHVAQGGPWWETVGGVERPTRRHLGLIMWAYSPTPAKLKRYIAQVRRNPLARFNPDQRNPTSSNAWAEALDAALAESDLAEEVSADDFDQIADLLGATEVGRGDFSLVLAAGRGKVLKVLTDGQEARTLRAIQGAGIPSLPKVYEVKRSRYFDLHYALLKRYSPLPRRWREALRRFIHQQQGDVGMIAAAYGLEPHAVASFFAAIDALPVALHDWTPDNVMWDKQHAVPVLTDLGAQ